MSDVIQPASEISSSAPATAPANGRIFLSYAHRDASDIAKRIQKDLVNLGHDVWCDWENIRGSDNWRSAIKNAILDNQLIVFLMTRASTAGGEAAGDGTEPFSICCFEVDTARDAKKKILPVQLEDNINFGLTDPLSATDLRNWQDPAGYRSQFKRLLDDIDHCLQGGQVPLRDISGLSLESVFALFAGERRANFIGREWLFDELEERLSAPARKAVQITGGPGSGKSAFAAEFAARNPDRVLAHHYCRHDNLKTSIPPPSSGTLPIWPRIASAAMPFRSKLPA